MSHHVQPHTCEHSLCVGMYDSGQEGINHFATLGGDYFIVFCRIQHSSSYLVIFQCGGHSSDCQKVGYMGIDPGHCQCVYLILFYHIHDATYHGGSKDHWDPSHKIGQVWDHEGYQIFIVALDSICLNPYDDVAKGLSGGIFQTCTDYSSAYKVWERPDIQRVSSDEPQHDGVDLCTIVQDSHTFLPIVPYSGYILYPIPLGKGIGIQEGSLDLAFYTWGFLPWDTLSVATFPWGVWAPFLSTNPSFWFKGEFASVPASCGQLQIKWSGLSQW